MKKEVLLPATAWLGGAVGFFLRRWELAQGYDPHLRLLETGPATWLLWGLSAALLLVFALACCAVGREERSPEQWFYAPVVGYMTWMVCAGFVLMAGGLVGFWQQGSLPVKEKMLLLTDALCIVGGGCVLLVGQSVYRGLWNKHTPLLFMGPSFATLVWLIACYQDEAKQPQVELYVWQLLSAVAATLAVYTMVTLAVNRGGARRGCLFSLMGISLCLTTLADGHDLSFTLIYLFALLYLTAQSWLLLRVAGGRAWPNRMSQGVDGDESSDTEE